MSVLNRIKNRQKVDKKLLTVDQFLNLCKKKPEAYANPYERLLKALGEPKIVDTSEDPRLSRLYQNRKIKVYETFSDFYGIESTIESIANYLQAAAMGLEESNQILYLLGPVGSAKSSIAERLKLLIEKESFYAIKGCPVHESPLNLFDMDLDGDFINSKYGIPPRYLKRPLCPYCVRRLEESDGDPSVFEIEEMYPSRLKQVAVAKTEPADESNQDISALVGKVDVRKLADYAQDDPRAYSFSGGLNKANRGVLDFVEMFKAPIKTLNPLLTATQEGNYNSTEGFSSIPWDGVIVSHSNETEWDSFKNDKRNEAFLDRVCLIRVPYVLSKDEEIQIYKKMLSRSALSTKPCAPKTLEMLAEWSILTRLKPHENSTLYTKLKAYNGEVLKNTDTQAKSLIEYRETAGIDEGMKGMSTRFAFKVLSATFHRDTEEVAANPVHLMSVLEEAVLKEKMNEDKEKSYKNFIHEHLRLEYKKELEKEIQTAYLESYAEYGQNLYEKYFYYAKAYVFEEDFRDPDTGEIHNRDELDKFLATIERPAGISNPKDFRNDIVLYALDFQSNNNGDFPRWNSYEKIREVLESKMFSNTDDLLPVIAFGKKGSKEDEEKHNEFLKRMMSHGYTERQVKMLVDWFMRVRKNT